MNCSFKVSASFLYDSVSILATPCIVPPVVVSVNQRVVGNKTESAILNFRIENAAPPVVTSDIRWYYTHNAMSRDPDFTSGDFMDITNLSTRTTSGSVLTYGQGLRTLTVSNILQALMVGEETDAGRYFLRASNPAGEDGSFIDLVVFGK